MMTNVQLIDGCDSFRKTIRVARDDVLFTQKQLADYAGITSTSVAMIERGERSPSLATAIAICDALGYDLALVKRKEIRCG